MITEIKRRKTRLEAIISFYDPAVNKIEDLKALEGLGFASSFIYLHRVGASERRGNGLNWVGHKAAPKMKQILGHYLTQFRGDGVIAFIDPRMRLLSDAERVYGYVDSLRFERSYAFHLGPFECPRFIGVSASTVEHLFHAVPDQMEFGEAWFSWLSAWLRKSLIGGRYFDAEQQFAYASSDPVSEPEHQDVVAESPPQVVDAVAPVRRGRKPRKPKPETA